MNKIFIDANILIDLVDEKRVNHKKVIEIFEYLIDKNIEIYTSCDLMTTIYYIINKHSKIDGLDVISQINNICVIIPFSNDEVEFVIKMMKEDKLFKDFEDTLQFYLAKKLEVDCILSNDKGFYSPNIEISNVEKFYQKMELK